MEKFIESEIGIYRDCLTLDWKVEDINNLCAKLRYLYKNGNPEIEGLLSVADSEMQLFRMIIGCAPEILRQCMKDRGSYTRAEGMKQCLRQVDSLIMRLENAINEMEKDTKSFKPVKESSESRI